MAATLPTSKAVKPAEPYDIALSGDALGVARPLITALRDPKIQASIANLGGCDLAQAGAVESLGDENDWP